MCIVCRDKRNIKLLGQAEYPSIYLTLFRNAMILDLEIKILRTENPAQAARIFARTVKVPLPVSYTHLIFTRFIFIRNLLLSIYPK